MVGQGGARGMKSIESLDLEFSFSTDVLGRCPPPTHVGAESLTPPPVCTPRMQPDEREWPPRLAILFSGNCVVLLIYTELWEASL